MEIPQVPDADALFGVLLSANRPFLGPMVCRIRFIQSLTFQSFKLLVNGPDLVPATPRDLPEHEADWLWR
ncbi:hypothetical protein [Aquisphaera giovannonii]|uniref:hypothetical protein n=1 Tax=Aquisphaera giovannonii TaxID=406548 RepID=UPI0011DF3EE1|nr:hypothetical protein [Aquisphaera giovannonii]